MFNDFKFSPKAREMILDHHYNRRGMQGAIDSYLKCSGSE